MVTFKFLRSKDYTTCSFDLFKYNESNERYITLENPFLIYFAGEGNFLRPFYID